MTLREQFWSLFTNNLNFSASFYRGTFAVSFADRLEALQKKLFDSYERVELIGIKAWLWRLSDDQVIEWMGKAKLYAKENQLDDPIELEPKQQYLQELGKYIRWATSINFCENFYSQSQSQYNVSFAESLAELQTRLYKQYEQLEVIAVATLLDQLSESQLGEWIEKIQLCDQKYRTLA